MKDQDNIDDLFLMLDCDSSGSLSIQEFCDGISKLATSETGIETLLMLKLQKSQRHGERSRS